MTDIIKDYYLWIIIAELIIIILLIIWLLFKYLFPKDNSGVIDSLERVNSSLRTTIASKQQDIDQYSYINKQLRIKLKQWETWYAGYKRNTGGDTPNDVVENSEGGTKSDILTERQASSYQYQYLQEANGSRFMKFFTTPDKCFFRTWVEEGVRKFEFYGNTSKALANINAIFDDVCVIEGKRSGATIIENVCPGTLDSDLRIIHKAKIRLK